MDLQDEVLINLFGQNRANTEAVFDRYNVLDVNSKKKYLNDLLFLILQSKPLLTDIEIAITESKLKPTFTPCVLLHKGVSRHNLEKILELPEEEHEKVLRLFLSLFKVAYQRRFEIEKNDPNKWWYWDFSNEENYRIIMDRIDKKA